MKNMRHPPKRSFTFGLLVSALLVFLLVVQETPVWASPAVNATTSNSTTISQLRSTVNTSHFSVSLLYPASASPGQSYQISAITFAKSSANVITFSIDISSHVNGQPVKLASETVLEYATVQTGAEFETLLRVNIPADAQPGPLIGTVTEVWQQTSNYYSSYYTQSYPYYITYNARLYTTYNTQQHVEYPSNTPQYIRSSNGYVEDPSNTPQDVRYPNGFVALQVSPQNRIQTQSGTQSSVNMRSYQPTYTYGAQHYYPSNYYANYAPDYVTTYVPISGATQDTSQQTVELTYVT